MAVTFDEVRELKKTVPQPEGGGPRQEAAMHNTDPRPESTKTALDEADRLRTENARLTHV